MVLPAAPAYAATLPTGARSLESVNYPGRYVRHLNSLGQLDPVTSGSTAQTKLDATFTVVNGLASPACYSFQTKGGLFLRHRDWRLRVDANTGDATFRGGRHVLRGGRLGRRLGLAGLVQLSGPPDPAPRLRAVAGHVPGHGRVPGGQLVPAHRAVGAEDEPRTR